MALNTNANIYRVIVDVEDVTKRNEFSMVSYNYDILLLPNTGINALNVFFTFGINIVGYLTFVRDHWMHKPSHATQTHSQHIHKTIQSSGTLKKKEKKTE